MSRIAMHIGVLFQNIGGYHAARLRATQIACEERGWQLTAIEVTSQTGDHPWGDLAGTVTFACKTLLPLAEFPVATAPSVEARLAIPRLRQVLAELQLDALAIPGWGFAVSRAALSWCTQHQVTAILMSESKRDDLPRQRWKEWLKSVLYVRRFAGAIAGGEAHREYLVTLGMARSHIFLGYDVVDNRHFAQGVAIARANPRAIRQRDPAIPEKPYFLAVTRFIPRKNVLRLLTAYCHYRQALADQGCGETAWDLVLCGSGEEEATLRQRIQQNALETCVHLPGFVGYPQLPYWYALASAFVHPALQEQWGLVVNEACASGLPILCSQTVGACPNLVRHQENGLVFAPDDTGAIAQSLLQIHHLDADRRTEWGFRSQQQAANYTPQRFADGLMNALETTAMAANSPDSSPAFRLPRFFSALLP